MRINIIFLSLIIPLLQVSAASHAQTITLNKKNVSIEQVFKALKQQTDYDFVYSKKQLEGTASVSIAVKNATLKEILDYCLENQPLSYVMEDRTIFIKRVNKKPAAKGTFVTGVMKLHGKVTDSLDKPLYGATVRILGQTNETRTNEDGIFTINSEQNSGTLIIAYIGYKTQQIKFDETSVGSFDVVLAEIESVLKEFEVVSTGYQNITKERATGSFTQIENKTLNRNVGINILDRLESLASGLIINRNLPTTTGSNNSKLSVRGRSTLFANAEPLIVLDGFPYEGNIDQINPADIETITVLKDAAAASIWGTRASNGVIVITSKRGKNNNKTTIGVLSTLTMAKKPDLYYIPQISSSDFVDLEAYLFAKGQYSGVLNTTYLPISPAVAIFDQRKRNLISKSDSASMINTLKSYDVRKDIDEYAYRPSIHQQYSLNISGGNETNRYYLSGGYDKNLENSVTNKYSRLTLNANNTYSLLDNRLNVSGGVNFVSSNTNALAGGYSPTTPYERLADEQGNSLHVAQLNSALRSAYIDTAGNGKLLDWHYRPKDEYKSNTLMQSAQYRILLSADLKIIDGLNLTGSYQYLNENNSNTINRTVDSFYARNLINQFSSISGNNIIRGIPLGGILDDSKNNIKSNLGRLQLNYQKVIANDNEINAIAGYESNDTRLSSDFLRMYGYNPETMSNGNNTIDPNRNYRYYYQPNSSQRFSTSPSKGENLNFSQSFYTNVSYAYRGKYILSGSLRKDESNIFGVTTNKKGVPLWSTGIAWVVNKEAFYAIDWLSSLKLRATYGYNGNVDKTVSGYLTVINSGRINDWGSNYSQIQNPPNPLLRWEKVKMWNLGLDYELFKGRMNGSFDIYQKNAIDLIGNNPIAMQTGVTQFRGNGANLRTRGLDWILNSKNLVGLFNWGTTLLANYNTDKVTSYKIKQTSNRDVISGNFNNPLEGYPYYAVFSFPSAGLDATGMPQGYLNGTVSKDYTKIMSTFDPVQIKYHGSASPKYFGSIINTFSYRNFELSLNVVYKFDYYFRRLNVFHGSNYTYASNVNYEKRWQIPGDELKTRIPALIYPSGTSGQFFQNAEDVVERGDHIRLQDVRVTYQLPLSSSKKSVFKNASVFLYSKNLGILWRKNDVNVDPDYGSFTIPQSLSSSLGINLQF